MSEQERVGKAAQRQSLAGQHRALPVGDSPLSDLSNPLSGGHGDGSSFPTLLDNLNCYLRRRVPKQELQDLIGDVLLQAVQAWMRGGNPDSFRALALKISRNVAADFHRRQERRPKLQPLSGLEPDESRSDVPHGLRDALERMLVEVRPLLTKRQQELADRITHYPSRTSLARRMSMNLRDLDSSILAIAKKVRRSQLQNSPPLGGQPCACRCSAKAVARELSNRFAHHAD